MQALVLGGEGLSNTEYWAIGGTNAQGTLFTNAKDATKNPASRMLSRRSRPRASRLKPSP